MHNYTYRPQLPPLHFPKRQLAYLSARKEGAESEQTPDDIDTAAKARVRVSWANTAHKRSRGDEICPHRGVEQLCSSEFAGGGLAGMCGGRGGGGREADMHTHTS